MLKNFIFQNTGVPLLKKALDVYSLRQKAIASNVANVGTLGYKRKEIKFEEELQSQLTKHVNGQKTDQRHLPLGSSRAREVDPVLRKDESNALTSGANNVDIDKEIVDQVKNEIRYNYASRLVSGQFNALRASIKGHFDR